MKTGVSSYSFHDRVSKGLTTQWEAISLAKAIGFEVFEFAGLQVPDGEPTLSYAARVAEECRRVGIEVGNYTIGADLLNGSNGDLREETARLGREVAVAKALGATGMRHDATVGFPKGHVGPKSFETALPRLIEGCRAVTEIAAEQGIRTMVENHGFFAQDSDRIERLVCGVDHPNFGALVDIGNFLCADEAPVNAVGRLAPYAFHVHAKDFHVKPGDSADPGDGWFRSRGRNLLRGAILGHGDVPVAQCLGILTAAGYDGTVSLEFEGMEESLTGIEVGYRNLVRCLGRT